jgi:recombinational DNA repair ATPase RecF
MDLAEFRKSLSGRTPPAGSTELLEALWYEAHGNWERAHKIAQSKKGKAAAAVHAYLHRKEGDLSNADYWYERAGRERSRGALEQEWQALAAELLGRGKE